jgi:hypothetical protein
MKFCLRFKPPTLALVYQLAESKGSKKPHKYVKEFRLDLKEGFFGAALNEHLSKICEELFEREPTYFNPQKISEVQVRDFPLEM